MSSIAALSQTAARRRNRPTDHVSMTPMIDVVFLLLIYFVFTFSLPPILSRIEINRPRGEGVSGIDLSRITVNSGELLLNGNVVSLTQLESYFNRMADLDPETSLLIEVSNGSEHGELVEVLDLTEKAGLLNKSVITKND